MATAGTAIALHGFRIEVLASESSYFCPTGTKVVKKKRVFNVTMTGNGSATGEGSGDTKSEALAKATQNLQENLKNAGQCTYTEDLSQKENATVPKCYRVTKFFKTATGEAPPGVIQYSTPPTYFPVYAEQPSGPWYCIVEGSISTSGTLTYLWEWKCPVNIH